MRGLHEVSSSVRSKVTRTDRLTPSNLNKENARRTFLRFSYLEPIFFIEPDQMTKRSRSRGHLFSEKDMNNTSLNQRMKDQALHDLTINM